MARLEMNSADMGGMAAGSSADIMCEMGLAYATGRDCALDMVTAHKWLNIAAIKGSARAAQLRTEIASCMSKAELAAALRSAREWMTQH